MIKIRFTYWTDEQNTANVRENLKHLISQIFNDLKKFLGFIAQERLSTIADLWPF